MEEVSKLNLYQKINLVMQRVKSVHKGATVSITQNSSYKAVSHDDVTALLHDPITEARLVAIPTQLEAKVTAYETRKEYQGKVTTGTGYIVEQWAAVTYINIDNPMERETTKCFAYALDSGDKATGKAYSMAVKYCHLKTFLLESQDEEESRDFENPAFSTNSRSMEKSRVTQGKPGSQPTENVSGHRGDEAPNQNRISDTSHTHRSGNSGHLQGPKGHGDMDKRCGEEAPKDRQGTKGITEAQKKAVYAISKKKGIDPIPSFKTAKEAAEWITEQNKR